MNEKSSGKHVGLGVLLGVVLLPFAIAIGAGAFYRLSGLTGEVNSLEAMMMGFMYFGVMQVITTLPAAGIAYAYEKHGMARGLLYFGATLAVINVVLWATCYRTLVR